MQEYFATLTENFVNAIPNIITAILILVISFYGGVLLSRLLDRVLKRQNAEPGITHLLTRTLKWTFIILGAITALQRFFNVTAFLTGLGIIGFTIGFALQNIMQNFVSGVILLIQQPFKVGHSVNIANFDGRVLKIGLRTTEIQALDGRIIFLPNADVIAQPIINYTRANLRRVEIPISVSHVANPEQVRAIVLDELKSIKGFITTPEPQVLFNNFSTSIDMNILFWVDTSIASPSAAKDEALTRIKQAFETNQIEMPHPVQLQVETQQKSAPKRKTE